VRNPGGLAVTLMADGGPPELDLERAEIALALRTLDRDAIDSQLRRREYARLAEQTNALVAQKAEQGDPPGAQAATDPDQHPPPDETGLDYRPGNGLSTIRDLWQAVLGELSLQLNRSTYTS
jgi:hypothetical protein